MKKLMSITAIVSIAFSQTLTVCPTKGNNCDYTSIQTAINDAKSGDTVFIKKGIYKEHDITLNKCVNIEGESKRDVIIYPQNEGRALYIKTDGCSMNLKNFTIKSGFADNGGAIYAYNSGYSNPLKLSIDNLSFIGNSAVNGGAIYLYSYGDNFPVNILNTEFISNNANAGAGGAIYENMRNNLIIEHTLFKQNEADNGGAIYQIDHSSLKITSSIFTNNIAKDAGGAILAGSKLIINKSWIVNNEAKLGGGIDTRDSYQKSITLNSTIIANNKADNGGGISLGDAGTDNYDDGKIIVLINNSNIINNSAKTAKDIYFIGDKKDDLISAKILNSVIGDVYFEKKNTTLYGSYTIRFSYLQNPIESNPNITLEKNIINQDDKLKIKDIANLDFSLMPDSILRDKADAGSSYLEDITGSIRTGEPDIGACEYPSICKFSDPKPHITIDEYNDKNTTNSCVSNNVKEVANTISINRYWNLVGLPITKKVTIANLFKDNLSNIKTLWKWDNKSKKWKLFTTDEKIKNYVTKHPVSIDLVDENSYINVGDGFWINANNKFNLTFKSYEKGE